MFETQPRAATSPHRSADDGIDRAHHDARKVLVVDRLDQGTSGSEQRKKSEPPSEKDHAMNIPIALGPVNHRRTDQHGVRSSLHHELFPAFVPGRHGMPRREDARTADYDESLERGQAVDTYERFSKVNPGHVNENVAVDENTTQGGGISAVDEFDPSARRDLRAARRIPNQPDDLSRLLHERAHDLPSRQPGGAGHHDPHPRRPERATIC